jgi:hypothetical protein
MPQVQVFADVRRSADSMWRDLGSFQGIARWHPMLQSAVGQGEDPGATRILEALDGQKWTERLTAMEPSQRLYRYEVASTDLPIADFRGEFFVRDGGPHKCTVVWTALFTVTASDEKAISDTVREFFRAGVRAIENKYAVRPVAALRRRMRTLQRRRLV